MEKNVSVTRRNTLDKALILKEDGTLRPRAFFKRHRAPTLAHGARPRAELRSAIRSRGCSPADQSRHCRMAPTMQTHQAGSTREACRSHSQTNGAKMCFSHSQEPPLNKYSAQSTTAETPNVREIKPSSGPPEKGGKR